MRRPDVMLGDKAYLLLLLVPALLVVLFYVLPVLNVLVLSVSHPQPTVANYQLLLDSGAVQHILWVTARICVMTTVITVACAYVIAYRIVHAPPAEARFLLMAVVITFWISVLIRAFAWVSLLQPNGLINRLLMATGVITQPLSLVRNEVGVIAYPASVADADTMLEAAIEAGADDVSSGEDGHEVVCAQDSYGDVVKALEAASRLHARHRSEAECSRLLAGRQTAADFCEHIFSSVPPRRGQRHHPGVHLGLGLLHYAGHSGWRQGGHGR